MAEQNEIKKLPDELLNDVTGGTVGGNGISDDTTPFKIGDRFTSLTKSFEVIGIEFKDTEDPEEIRYICKVWFNMYFIGTHDDIQTRYGWELAYFNKV